MPQSERSEVIQDLMTWLEAKSKTRGATHKEIIHHVQVNITSMGATPRTCENYIRDLLNAKLIESKDLRWKVTKEGHDWIKRRK
jgi:predicted transcriptional regulator